MEKSSEVFTLMFGFFGILLYTLCLAHETFSGFLRCMFKFICDYKHMGAFKKYVRSMREGGDRSKNEQLLSYDVISFAQKRKGGGRGSKNAKF